MFHRPARLGIMLLTALLFTGCGGKGPTSFLPPIPAPTPAVPSVLTALPGDWLARGAPTANATLPGPIARFSGSLSVTGTSITGLFRVYTTLFVSGCPTITTAIPFTGTLDAANNLTLTAPLSGGIATITAALPQDLQTYISGTYQVIGGTCPMPATIMQLAQYAPATGTYTGTYNAMDPTTNTPIPGTATEITAALTESTTPSADGTFPLTGTVTSTGACPSKLAITTGFVSGGDITANPAGPAPTLVFDGSLNPTATTITGAYTNFFLSGCGNRNYFGTLTRQ